MKKEIEIPQNRYLICLSTPEKKIVIDTLFPFRSFTVKSLNCVFVQVLLQYVRANSDLFSQICDQMSKICVHTYTK